MNEKDFLQGYEIKNWEFSPRIYKIMAAAAVFNVLGLLVLAQTNIMSTSACESPFVNRVCSVLDAVYVGSKLMAGEKDYVVKDYNETEIQDADVVWVDSTNAEPQMSYPTGYFEIANRDELAAERLAQEMAENGYNTTPYTPGTIPPSTPPAYTPPSVTRRPLPKGRGSSLVNKKPVYPKKKDNITKGKVDDDLYETDAEEDVADKDNKAEDKDKNEDKNPIRDKTVTDSNPVTEVEINKKPLQDFADNVVDKWAKKEIDLNKQFVVRMVGRIKPDGRLDAKNSKFDTDAEKGDQKMIDLAKGAIEAVGDSGWLTYLKNLGATEIVITVMQNEDNIVARIESPMKTESEARTMASGMNMLLSTTKQLVKLGEDETKLLNAAKQSTSNGKVFILDLQMTKPEAQEIINRKLNEAWAKKQKEQNGNQTQTQPNSTVKQTNSKETLAK
jgi:hypothetical protein